MVGVEVEDKPQIQSVFILCGCAVRFILVTDLTVHYIVYSCTFIIYSV
jgi:hypothetical protein